MGEQINSDDQKQPVLNEAEVMKELETKLIAPTMSDAVNGKDEDISPHSVPSKNAENGISNELNTTSNVGEQEETEKEDKIHINTTKGDETRGDVAKITEFAKMVTSKQIELQNQVKNMDINLNTNTNKNGMNGSILSQIQKDWINAEAEKLNYKKLYEKERMRSNEYKSATNAANKKYEKSELELSVVRNEYEELQQKYEVMEEVYIKLKQDLTRTMDRYSKLEYEHEGIRKKLMDLEREKELTLNQGDDEEDDDVVSLGIDSDGD